MIKIEGKIYVIDIDKLMQWIVETPNDERNINTITTMTYPINIEDENITEKSVSETKSSLNETMNNIRYDLVKSLLNVIFVDFQNDINQNIQLSLDDLSFSQKIVFNTLLHKKIIIEINRDEND